MANKPTKKRWYRDLFHKARRRRIFRKNLFKSAQNCRFLVDFSAKNGKKRKKKEKTGIFQEKKEKKGICQKKGKKRNKKEKRNPVGTLHIGPPP